MVSNRRFTRRLALLLTAALAWISLGSAAFSLAVGHLIAGVVKAFLLLGLLVLAFDGRIYRNLESRAMPALGMLVLALSVLLLVGFEVSQLRFGLSAFEGVGTTPGLIRVGRAIGSFLLAGALALEIVRPVTNRS